MTQRPTATEPPSNDPNDPANAFANNTTPTVSNTATFQKNHGGNVSVTIPDNEHKHDLDEEKKMMQFTVGPKFLEALNNQLFDRNRDLEANGQPKISMASYLRVVVASSIGFDLKLDPRTSRAKYATDAERKAAIKATQQKAAEDRKKLTKLINLAKQKQGKKDAIAALMASLDITDADLD
jgi:hypothetical protein